MSITRAQILKWMLPIQCLAVNRIELFAVVPVIVKIELDTRYFIYKNEHDNCLSTRRRLCSSAHS